MKDKKIKRRIKKTKEKRGKENNKKALIKGCWERLYRDKM